MVWQDGITWLVGGLALGWAGSWLFEKSFRRSGPVDEAATHPITLGHLGSEVERLEQLIRDHRADHERIAQVVEVLDRQVTTLNLQRGGFGQGVK